MNPFSFQRISKYLNFILFLNAVSVFLKKFRTNLPFKTAAPSMNLPNSFAAGRDSYIFKDRGCQLK